MLEHVTSVPYLLRLLPILKIGMVKNGKKLFKRDKEGKW
jgi:hypothetical protein